MPADSFHHTLDRALEATRDDALDVCIVCKVGHVTRDPDAQGRWWVHCFTCGSHYWLD